MYVLVGPSQSARRAILAGELLSQHDVLLVEFHPSFSMDATNDGSEFCCVHFMDSKGIRQAFACTCMCTM